MKFTRLYSMTPLDGLRYAGAHMVNAIVLLLTLGLYTSDVVHGSSLKMAIRFRQRELDRTNLNVHKALLEKNDGSSTV